MEELQGFNGKITILIKASYYAFDEGAIERRIKFYSYKIILSSFAGRVRKDFGGE